MQTYIASRPDAPLLVLAHGAGAGERHPWMQRVARGLADRGVSVVTFEFPYMQAGRRAPDKGAVLEEAFSSVWLDIAAAEPPGRGRAIRLFAGGKSMGGRIASQVAARNGLSPQPAGLIFFGYPLHPPGKPAERRDRHLASIAQPMLFLHGTRDPFGAPDEMQTLVDGLPGASLHLIDGGDHSLQASRRGDRSNTSIDHAIDLAASWIADRRAIADSISNQRRTDMMP
jgi:predicted alpha/beta-hydrolase family hydrolase